jgi:hypothetical protein
MRYPPRLAHLATRAVVVAKLMPTYALAHDLDEDQEEAGERLNAALGGKLLEDLLATAWESLKGETKKLDENGLLEKVARTLKDRPLRPGRKATLNPAWSAFMVLADLHAARGHRQRHRAKSPRIRARPEDGRRRPRAGWKASCG